MRKEQIMTKVADVKNLAFKKSHTTSRSMGKSVLSKGTAEAMQRCPSKMMGISRQANKMMAFRTI